MTRSMSKALQNWTDVNHRGCQLHCSKSHFATGRRTGPKAPRPDIQLGSKQCHSSYEFGCCSAKSKCFFSKPNVNFWKTFFGLLLAFKMRTFNLGTGTSSAKWERRNLQALSSVCRWFPPRFQHWNTCRWPPRCHLPTHSLHLKAQSRHLGFASKSSKLLQYVFLLLVQTPWKMNNVTMLISKWSGHSTIWKRNNQQVFACLISSHLWDLLQRLKSEIHHINESHRKACQASGLSTKTLAV